MPWDHCGHEGLLDDATCPTCGSDRGLLSVTRGGLSTLRLTRPRALKLRLLDRAGAPIAGEPFQVELPGGQRSEGELDERGEASLPSPKGEAQVTWPNRLPADFLPPPPEQGEPGRAQEPAQEAEETEEGGARFRREVGRRHVFCVKPRLRVKVTCEKGRALGDARYQLALGEEQREGRTSGEGLIDEELPDGVQAATLTVHRSQGPPLLLKLQLGQLAGLGSLTGAQARLNALGFDCGKVDDDRGPKLANAVAAFQKSQGLPPSGQLDEDTQAKLREAYGL